MCYQEIYVQDTKKVTFFLSNAHISLDPQDIGFSLGWSSSSSPQTHLEFIRTPPFLMF